MRTAPAGPILPLACGPLTTPWPKPETPKGERRYGPFKVAYDATFRDLRRELDVISARDVEAEFDMAPTRFRRMDSLPYADGVVQSPRVLVSFRRGEERLVFACDTYTTWLANLRAISLTLTALRAVERYGASEGAQYRGFRRLPGAGQSGTGQGTGQPEPLMMTPGQAARVVADVVYAEMPERVRVAYASLFAREKAVVAAAIRDVLKRLHPDSGNGDREAFERVMLAKRVLEAAHAAG